MKQKGFAISGILYSILILFLALMLGIMTTLAKQKVLLDKIKSEVNQRLNQIQKDKPVTPEIAYLCTKANSVDLSNLNYSDAFSCELGDGISRVFYLLEEKDGEISLILNENLGANVAWASKADYVANGGTEASYGSNGNNDLGALTVEVELQEQTKEWTKLNKNQIGLPTGKQLAIAGGDTSWEIDHYTAKVLPSWLTENLDGTTKQGYWTSNGQTNNTACAWALHFNGVMYGHYINDTTPYGVRPVITISKNLVH